MLRSRTSRREEPLTPDAPEPLATGTAGSSPEQEALLADSVGSRYSSCSTGWRRRSASPSCCSTCSPCRSRRSCRSSAVPQKRRAGSPAARRRVRGCGAPDPDLGRQREVVETFLAALRDGDLESLLAVLNPDLMVRAEISGVLTESRGAAPWAKGAVAYGHLAKLTQPALVQRGHQRRGGAAGTTGEAAPLHDRERQDHPRWRSSATRRGSASSTCRGSTDGPGSHHARSSTAAPGAASPAAASRVTAISRVCGR